MAKAIHTMIRVFDLDRSMRFYQDAFELEDAEHRRFGDLGFEPRERAEIRHEEKPLARFFFFVEDPDGYKIEVIQRVGRNQ